MKCTQINWMNLKAVRLILPSMAIVMEVWFQVGALLISDSKPKGIYSSITWLFQSHWRSDVLLLAFILYAFWTLPILFRIPDRGLLQKTVGILVMAGLSYLLLALIVGHYFDSLVFALAEPVSLPAFWIFMGLSSIAVVLIPNKA